MKASFPSPIPLRMGSRLLQAARLTGDERLRQAADRMLKFLSTQAPRTRMGSFTITTSKTCFGGFFLYGAALPGCCRAPTGSHPSGTWLPQQLFDPARKLYHHIWDEDRQEFARQAFWGVGNGWAAAGLSRVIRAMP